MLLLLLLLLSSCSVGHAAEWLPHSGRVVDLLFLPTTEERANR